MATRELKATVFYNAGELTYNFPFDYLKKDTIKVAYVDDMEADTIDSADLLTYNTDYTIIDKTLTLKQSNTDKALIYIFRDTPTEPIVTFKDSSILKAYDMNIQHIQQSYILVELSDYLILHKISTATIEFIKEAIDITTLNKQEAQEAALKAAQEAEKSISNAAIASEAALNAQNNAEQASDYAHQAEQSSQVTSPEAYSSDKTYSFPDVVAYTDGETYRCIGENITGETPDTSPNWVRIAGIKNDFWDIDIDGGLMPAINPMYSEDFVLDSNGDIMPREMESDN